MPFASAGSDGVPPKKTASAAAHEPIKLLLSTCHQTQALICGQKTRVGAVSGQGRDAYLPCTAKQADEQVGCHITLTQPDCALCGELSVGPLVARPCVAQAGPTGGFRSHLLEHPPQHSHAGLL